MHGHTSTHTHTHTHMDTHACTQQGDKLVEYDGKDEKLLTRDDIKCPDGWLWKIDWTLDKNRAVDEDGWSMVLGGHYITSIVTDWSIVMS